MFRKLAVFAAAALALSAVGIGTSGAAPTAPPTGTLNCGTTGVVKLKPGIPSSTEPASTKNISVKIHKAAVDTCDATLVTGGKAPITGGDIVLNGKIPPGANCATLIGSPPNITKAQLIVKLTNTTDGETSTVVVLKPTDLVFTQVGLGIHIAGTLPHNKSGNKPFDGETLDIQLNIDNLLDALACVGDSVSLDHMDFSTAGGSTLSIS